MVKAPSTPPDPWIFHITHLDNLNGILRAGGLHCDATIQRCLTVTNIGHRHIKARRLSRTVSVAAGGHLGDYVPFNFCSRSVMLYAVMRGHDDYPGGQDAILHVVSTMDRAISAGRPWAFTDRHAELAHAAYFTDKAHLLHVDWSVMPLLFWAKDPLTKELRQAEFLVHEFFPWDAVARIGVRSSAVKAAVEQLLQVAGHRPTVDIRPDWYY